MTGFIDLANGCKTSVLALLLLLNLYQFRYLFMLCRHRKIRLLLWNLIPAAFVFCAMPFLGSSVFLDSGVLKDLPVAAILLIWLCLVIYTTAAVVSEMRQAKEMLTSNSIKEAFDSLGIKEIPALGEKFDPKFHNAVMHIENPAYEENVITDVYRKGYTLGDKVIRFSMVVVAN